MASKTLTITEDVYHNLKDLKQNGESFSKLFKRLITNNNGQYLEEFFGAWKMDDDEFKKIDKTIKKGFPKNSTSRVRL